MKSVQQPTIGCLIILGVVLFSVQSALVEGAVGNSCPTPNNVCACGAPCNGFYESSNGFNTEDSCQDGSDQSDFEYVNEIIVTNINSTDFTGGNLVEIFVQFFCYQGDFISIAYTNETDGASTVWKNIFSSTCPGYNFYNVFYNHTLEDVNALHGVRGIIGFPGSANMVCGQSHSSSDTDDIKFYVDASPDSVAPTITFNSPTSGQSFESVVNLKVPINVTVTDLSAIDQVSGNITFSAGTVVFNLTNSTTTEYNVTIDNLTNITTYTLTVTANDSSGNRETQTQLFYIVDLASVNVTEPAFATTYNERNLSLRFRIGDDNAPFQEVYYDLNSGGRFFLNESLTAGNRVNTSPTLLSSNQFGLNQSFTLDESMEIQRIDLQLMIVANTTFSQTVHVRTNSSVGPSAVILANLTINSSLVSNESVTWVNVSVNGTLPLDANTPYWLTLDPSINDSNYLLWQSSGGNYFGGSFQNDTGLDTLFVLYDVFKYNATLNTSEGSNSIEVCERNVLSNQECTISVFTTDTIPPSVTTVTETADPFEFGTTFQIIGITLTDATSSIDTVIIEANFTNQSTENLGGGSYQYRWRINDTGVHTYRFYYNDTIGNANFTPYFTFLVNDSTPPSWENIVFRPNDEPSMDPNKSIAVNVTVTDFSEITNVTVQFKVHNATDWRSANMGNASSLYQGNFTPDQEANWSFRVVVEDIFNNTNTSEQQNASVFFDYTWNVSITTLQEIFTTQGQTEDAGNITLNNSGDFNLSYTLVKTAGIPTVTPNITSFDLENNSFENINVDVLAPVENSEPYPYTITISCSTTRCTPTSIDVDGTIAVGEGGPFLSFTEILFDPTVTQGDRGITLNATFRNIGNETAHNVTVNWTTPEGWTSPDSQNKSYENITIFQTTFVSESFGIETNVGLNASNGTTNVSVHLTYYTESGSQLTRSSYKTVTVAHLEGVGATTILVTSSGGGSSSPTTSGGGGGGSGGGGGGGVVIRKRTFHLDLGIPTIVDALRGQNRTISVNLSNPNNVSFHNVTFELVGFPSARYQISKDFFSRIDPFDTKHFNVTFAIPRYMGHGQTQLTLEATGFSKRTEESSAQEFSQEQAFTLIVSEVNQNESRVCLVHSIHLVENLTREGYETTEITLLVDQAEQAFAGFDFQQVTYLCEDILNLNQVMRTVSDELGRMKHAIQEAQSQGYDVSSSDRLLTIAQDLLNQGQYLDAQTSLADAELTLELQISSEDAKLTKRVAKLWDQYWYVFILFLFMLICVSLLGYRKYAVIRITNRLASLEKEEKHLHQSIIALQQAHFVHAKISNKSYALQSDKHHKRLLAIEAEKSDLKHTKVSGFSITKSIQGLQTQREELEHKIKKLQLQYYSEHAITPEDYKKSFAIYKKQLADINKKISVKQIESSPSPAHKKV